MKKYILILIGTIGLSSCTPEAKTDTVNENNLASKVAYADKINNTVVYSSNDYKMIAFALKSDQVMKPHSAPVDAPLLMLEGSAKITIGDAEHILKSGDIITLPKNILHGVYPITDCKFLLIK
ncbi:AraC-like protein [Aquimarina sp. MAR_2010_214]|uniref:cupin domain-containing protein n=1 Tax=Aquimarina sp. MAR_2010_214 TaxID=1250026 RepID=UPI000C710816|nr:cupin domain-containing protein [Aquimarina sp. MAR_2010_214]PKV48377.1 AraC-like protein [Aquimarina sp. MAR_2010_214]